MPAPSSHSPSRRTSALSLFLLLLGVAVVALQFCPLDEARHHPPHVETASTSQARASSLRIWTWNLNWLHHRDGAGLNKRDALDYAALARYVRQIDADVVVVQEVDGEEALRRIFDPGVYAFHVSSRDNVQRVAIVYKRSLEVVRHPDVVAVARVYSERLRYGVDLGVRDPVSGEELRILGVHLKSGCFRSPLEGPYLDGESEDACTKLRMQLPVLERWMKQRAEERSPFMLVGDFNRRFGHGESIWESWRWRMPELGLSSPTVKMRSQCWGGRYPEFIDHLVLDARAAKMMARRTTRQLLYEEQDAARHGYRLSDHCPVGFD